MSAFDDALEAYMSDQDDATDIRATVRRLWFYDIDITDPATGQTGIRLWDGTGRLHTSDGKIWLGTIIPKVGNVHQTPRLADGRDGTAPNYEFGLGYLDKTTYAAIKADETIIAGRPLTCYLALLRAEEGLRPSVPIDFLKDLTIYSRSFDESLARSGTLLNRRYKIKILAKDGNSGRSNQPSRTYADTMQKEYAQQIGAGLDRGCEFLGTLAYRTYKAPN